MNIPALPYSLESKKVTRDEAVSLRDIPLHDIRQSSLLDLLALEKARAEDILHAGMTAYGKAAEYIFPTLYKWGDRLTFNWLKANNNPYAGEILNLSRAFGHSGLIALNCSYEWACTAGAVPDHTGAPTLVRVLDWFTPGLGRNVVVAHQQGSAGDFYNVTWPGLAGVYTASAPGRFAASINQTPIKKHHGILALDWLRQRRDVKNSTALPPSHLLRQVMEECATYAEAKERLMHTPICIGAYFTLTGLIPGEGCVIERSPNDAALLPYPACTSNHWQSTAMRQAYPKDTSRGVDSVGRLKMLHSLGLTPTMWDYLNWLNYPILNRDTRLVVVACPARGTLVVQGFEPEYNSAYPATKVLRIEPETTPMEVR